MYEQFSSAIETIHQMEHIRLHPLLTRLGKLLTNSVQDWEDSYRDLKIGESFLKQLTDCLYGAKRQMGKVKKPMRYPEVYRKEHTATQVKNKVEQLLENFQNQHKTVSPLLRSFIRHFNNTYDNWKANLFTCYDHDFIPNDNNALEASHNQLKRAIRKITGHKSSAKPLLIYGEELLFCQPYFDQQPEQFLEALIQVDFDKTNQRRKQILEKQWQRGRQTKLIHHTENILR